MPYTPPSHQSSPALSALTSPVALSAHQRSASASYFHPQPSPPRSPGPRPNLPRSSSATAYTQKFRRAPSHLAHASLENVSETEVPQRQDLIINTSVRQTPSPVTDPTAAPGAMPAGAIVSPPDSAHNSSDDEDTIRGQPVTSLEQLHQAVRQLEVNRNATVIIEQPAAPTDSSADRPVTPPGHLSATARKISHSRSSSEIPTYSPPVVSAIQSAYASDEDDLELVCKPPLIRKKSGELVKPAIRPKPRRKPSSMPGTPTFSKAVHFNEDIEQVRHFLHSERPIAVSAGTSPVEVFDDEHEFPWNHESAKPSDITIRLPNFPRDTHERQTAPVRLERLSMSPDKKHIIGVVAVANLAFNKLVRARFTFDHWRTTSEVVAEYNNDPRQPPRTDNYDQFNFSVKLSDQGNLDAKTMFVCIRYGVNGQDYWDSNGGLNYQVEFDVTRSATATKHSSGPGGNAAIPRSRHNSPAARRPRSVPSFDDDFSSGYDGDRGLAFQFRNQKPQKPTLDLPDTPPTLKRPASTGNQFGSRYDFGASLSAALTQAQTSMSERSDLKPRHAPQLKAPGLTAPGLTAGAESPRPDTLLSTSKSLDSRAYQEFVSKFCFVRSAPPSRPQQH